MTDNDNNEVEAEPTEPNNLHYSTLATMLVVIVMACLFTILSIDKPMPAIYMEDGEASPLGYTRSLSLFLLPLLLLLYWFADHPKKEKKNWQAVKRTAMVVVPLWCIMDIVAALSFFEFPNCEATLQYYAWGWTFTQGWVKAIPIEEFVFYVGGVLLSLTLYIWSAELWFPENNILRRQFDKKARASIPLARVCWKNVAFGAIAMILALMYYYWVARDVEPISLLRPAACKAPPISAGSGGFPLYFTFLLVFAIGPSILLFHRVNQFINTQAMLFTITLVLGVSMMYEVTLAAPYGWWSYNRAWMIGIYIKPWYNLPIEAVLLWFSVGWSNVFLYEMFRIQAQTGVSLRRLLFGPPLAEDIVVNEGDGP